MSKVKTDKRSTAMQRQARTYQIIIAVISIIVIITFVLQLIK